MPSKHTTNPANDLSFRIEDRRKLGYFRIDNVVVDDIAAQLGPYGFAVYACLCRFANAEQECWPKFSTIAARMGMSRRKVIYEIHHLEELGLIAVERSTHASNTFVLLDWSAPHAPQWSAQDAPPSARRAPRTKPKKQDPHPKIEKEDSAERRRSYLPDELRDIMLG